jgi:protein-tyrosine phosphatase
MARMSSTPDRSLGLTGATNFRDLGGYVGRDGRPLRWRRLFRSDHMGALTDADLAQLATLGLARSFDFRGVDERAAMPNRLPGVQQHPLSIEPTVVQSLQLMRQSGQALTVAVVAAEMHTLYRSMINDQSQRFAELFEHLLQNDVPTVFHCTAGKDRTGLAAALILLALGVSAQQVHDDFLLSNALYRRPATTRNPALADVPPEALAVLWQVQGEYLQTALQTIDDTHGGIDRYLRQRLGVTAAARDTLAARYLQAG